MTTEFGSHWNSTGKTEQAQEKAFSRRTAKEWRTRASASLQLWCGGNVDSVLTSDSLTALALEACGWLREA